MEKKRPLTLQSKDGEVLDMYISYIARNSLNIRLYGHAVL